VNPVDIAIMLFSGSSGAALLLITSGVAGGWLDQPRQLKGVPVGKSPTPADSGNTGKPKPKPKPKPNQGQGQQGQQDGSNSGDGGGSGGGSDSGGDGTGDSPSQQGEGGDGIPLCKYDQIVIALLREVTDELAPYAISRQPAPWVRLALKPFNLSSEIPQYADEKNTEAGARYYVTAAIIETVLRQGLDPKDFSNGGNIVNPGCLLGPKAFEPGSPLRELLNAYFSGGTI